jgi:release factor H-coupled RctB family protein
LSEQKYNVLTSKSNWIEGEALAQLEHVASLPGMVQCFGMPDLHPGKGIPIGIAAVSKDMIYPHLAGNDIGCGMGLFRTDLKQSKFKSEKAVKKLSGLNSRWQSDMGQWLAMQDLPTDLADQALGTIGGGNHFAELQAVEKVYNTNLCHEIGLNPNRLLLLIHSGSRGIGESILRSQLEIHGTKGLASQSLDAENYLKKHDRAIVWARANRELIAFRFSAQLNTAHQSILDLCHNSISRIRYEDQVLWLHRKGAAPSNAGPVLIPGSRGSLSYLVQPLGEQHRNGWSLAHGAGRKWNRKSAKARLRERYTAQSLVKTKLGGYVICEDRELLYEEAPQAYKPIDKVIEVMVDKKIIRIVATFRPLITYKVRRSHD